MAHPNGGSGNTFNARNDFDQIYEYVGKNGVEFCSATEEKIFAKRSIARDGITKIIVFYGERSRHGSICHACWGFRKDCSGSRVGQCSEALDNAV